MCEFLQRISHLLRLLPTGKVSVYAAQSAFFIILSFFPAVMLLTTALDLFSFAEKGFADLLLFAMPKQINVVITELITELKSSDKNLIPLTVVTALWSSSKGVFAIMSGLNEAYGYDMKGAYFKNRCLALLYTSLFILTVLLTVGFIIPFKMIIDVSADSVMKRVLITVAKIIMQCTVLSLLFAIMYKYFPIKRSPFMIHLPGALLSACGWVVFTELFSLYILYSNSDIYGSLTSVILAMLWVYICFYIFLMGAFINNQIINADKKSSNK